MKNFDYSTYLSPFTWRYGGEKMRNIWSEVYKRKLWRKIWVELAKAQAEHSSNVFWSTFLGTAAQETQKLNVRGGAGGGQLPPKTYGMHACPDCKEALWPLRPQRSSLAVPLLPGKTYVSSKGVGYEMDFQNSRTFNRDVGIRRMHSGNNENA